MLWRCRTIVIAPTCFQTFKHNGGCRGDSLAGVYSRPITFHIFVDCHVPLDRCLTTTSHDVTNMNQTHGLLLWQPSDAATLAPGWGGSWRANAVLCRILWLIRRIEYWAYYYRRSSIFSTRRQASGAVQAYGFGHVVCWYRYRAAIHEILFGKKLYSLGLQLIQLIRLWWKLSQRSGVRNSQAPPPNGNRCELISIWVVNGSWRATDIEYQLTFHHFTLLVQCTLEL